MKKDKYFIDDEVIRSFQNGNTEAFSEIYKVYFNYVYFMAKQFFTDDDLAKDVTQETFIRVYQKIGSLKETKAFHNWIRRIVYNECLLAHRSRKKFVDLGNDFTVEAFMDSKQIDIETSMEQTRIKEVIEASIKNMSKVLQGVGYLRYVEGLQIEEIASTLTIPKGTVNSRLNRIRQQLKKDLIQNDIFPDGDYHNDQVFFFSFAVFFDLIIY